MSMSKHMKIERGNAVIVGKRIEIVQNQKLVKKVINKVQRKCPEYEKDKFNVDGIVIYDAYCLSSNIPYLL